MVIVVYLVKLCAGMWKQKETIRTASEMLGFWISREKVSDTVALCCVVLRCVVLCRIMLCRYRPVAARK